VLDEDDLRADLVGHSITYRIAVGPHRGRKVFTLQTLPANGWEDGAVDAPGNVADFSLYAAMVVMSTQRAKLERLCRYICRPPVSEKRLFLTPRGDIGYSLKNPLPRRQHARDLRAAGLHSPPGGSRPASAPESDPLTRGICAQQPVSCP